MVNDSDEPNAKMQVVLVDGKPHLCLFACDSIEENDEIRYDYGVPDLPWRKQVSTTMCQLRVSVCRLDQKYNLCKLYMKEPQNTTPNLPIQGVCEESCIGVVSDH